MEIALSNNQFVLIDDEDYCLVEKYRWVACKSLKKYYARTYFFQGNNLDDKKSLLLQHLIVGKPPKGKRLSFKDGNSLNCQKSNLEFITRSEAAHNYYKKVNCNKNATEKFKGVIVLYSAQIKFQNKVINLGSFSNEIEAAKAYNTKAIELYGLRAKINNV